MNRNQNRTPQSASAQSCCDDTYILSVRSGRQRQSDVNVPNRISNNEQCHSVFHSPCAVIVFYGETSFIFTPESKLQVVLSYKIYDYDATLDL
jgi:hypothetical protein